MARTRPDERRPHAAGGARGPRTRSGARPARAGVTRRAPHVRDGLDVRRAMVALAVAALPCAALGVLNTGRQVLEAAESEWLFAPPGWRGALLERLDLAGDAASPVAWLACGLLHLLPALAVACAVGLFWQRVFAALRGRPPGPGVPVMMGLLVLMLPPALPLWQVALGASFAVVVGLEIFGGLGRNVVHPVIAGFTFLYFAYPASFAGEGVWVGVPGADAAPVLRVLAQGGSEALAASGLDWRDGFVGWEPGAPGETSALACLVGAAFLLYAGLVSARVLAGGLLGLALTAALAGAVADPGRAAAALPWWWHATAGGFAFALVFLATDPATSPVTSAGRWAYGLLIGFLVVLIRVFNPAQPEGVALALLLANVLAPLIDHAVVQAHLLRRRRRHG